MENIIHTDRRRAIAAVVAINLAMAAIPPLLAMRVAYEEFLLLYGMIGLLLAVTAYLRLWRRSFLMMASESHVLLLFTCIPLVAISYFAMRLDMPIADRILGLADRQLGFSTPVFVKFLSGHPAVAATLAYSYAMLGPQTLLMPFLLHAGGAGDRVYRFTFAFVLFNVVALLCAIPFPSHGALVGQGVDPRSFTWISLRETFSFIAILEQVRNAPWFVLNSETMSGIITFPSIHAGSAALFIWAVWPCRPLIRYPVVALNLVMMVSALSCGGHYLVDVIAGDLLALGAAWLSRKRIAMAFPGLGGARAFLPQRRPDRVLQ